MSYRSFGYSLLISVLGSVIAHLLIKWWADW